MLFPAHSSPNQFNLVASGKARQRLVMASSSIMVLNNRLSWLPESAGIHQTSKLPSVPYLKITKAGVKPQGKGMAKAQIQGPA